MVQILTYSGAIRNWKSLCSELSLDPRSFADARGREEAILARAYEVWGTGMGNHLYGSFALILKDEEKDLTFALRDPFGTRTLYYYLTASGELLCGLSIADIAAQPGFVKTLNESILQLYLTMTYVGGEDTFYQGIRKLMPGCWLIWQNGRLQTGSYWQTQYHPDESRSLEDWADEIHTTIEKIIPEVKEPQEEAISFLSGGVDSSYMVAMAKDIAVTASCGYADERFDESPLARETAALLGRSNNVCLIGPEDYFEAVPFVMKALEQPIGDASTIALAIGCRELAKSHRLCYSGEGADEFFGGYRMYQNAERYGANLPDFYIGNTNIMKEDEKKALLRSYRDDVLPIGLTTQIYRDTADLDPLSRMMTVDIRLWLEGDIYFAISRLAAATGMEIRMPLTDVRIFDIASRMPSRYKAADGRDKIAFRMAAAKVLPEEIAFRKKMGFPVPIRLWLADSRYNEDMRRRFAGENAARFFRPEALEALLKEYLEVNDQAWRKVWTIYTFLVWYEEVFLPL